ncbi:unannotated protein [freshwater metagenome]|uniref:Unannotated protein n=1 Tax=freshwater metagenome TaxID=449393 RepID=A0A6J7ATM8_9ZZZZ
MTSTPSGCVAKPIQSLRAGKLRLLAKNVVPTETPFTASTSTFGRDALAMIARTPDQEAIRAADSLDAIPPLPRLLPDSVAATESNGSSAATTSISSADGSVRGSAVYRPGVSVSSTSTSAATLCATSAAMRSLSP